MNSDNRKLVGCLAYLLLIPLMYVEYGWVLSTLWRWFITPTFALPPIGIALAIGIAITVRMLVADTNAARETKDWFALIAGEFLYPLIALGAGWVIWRFFLR